MRVHMATSLFLIFKKSGLIILSQEGIKLGLRTFNFESFVQGKRPDFLNQFLTFGVLNIEDQVGQLVGDLLASDCVPPYVLSQFLLGVKACQYWNCVNKM